MDILDTHADNMGPCISCKEKLLKGAWEGTAVSFQGWLLVKVEELREICTCGYVLAYAGCQNVPGAQL